MYWYYYDHILWPIWAEEIQFTRPTCMAGKEEGWHFQAGLYGKERMR